MEAEKSARPNQLFIADHHLGALDRRGKWDRYKQSFPVIINFALGRRAKVKGLGDMFELGEHNILGGRVQEEAMFAIRQFDRYEEGSGKLLDLTAGNHDPQNLQFYFLGSMFPGFRYNPSPDLLLEDGALAAHGQHFDTVLATWALEKLGMRSKYTFQKKLEAFMRLMRDETSSPRKSLVRREKLYHLFESTPRRGSHGKEGEGWEYFYHNVIYPALIELYDSEIFPLTAIPTKIRQMFCSTLSASDALASLSPDVHLVVHGHGHHPSLKRRPKNKSSSKDSLEYIYMEVGSAISRVYPVTFGLWEPEAKRATLYEINEAQKQCEVRDQIELAVA